MHRALFPMVLVALLAMPPAADAARRYAAPSGSPTSLLCSAADPCSVERAVNLAATGDEVFVAAGTYNLTAPLRPPGAIDLFGDPDRSAPRLAAPASLKASALTLPGGTLTHLTIHGNAKDEDALVVEGGIVDGVIVRSASGNGATIFASDAGTVLRNSVVETSAPGGGFAAIELRDGGANAHVELRNVTAMARSGSATGIRCDVADGTASLVNTLARGKGRDLDATAGCTVAYSNFRPAFANGVGPGAGNQSAEPRFADGDYRPAAGSPTIDAGALDAFASSPDPDGRRRTLGSAPDIGAYEYAPPAANDGASAELPDAFKGVPIPVQGVSVLVAPARGTVRVRRPGDARFTVLDAPGRIPVGSLVDARRGRVQLVSTIDGGHVQAGVFWGSTFKTAQSRRGRGMTTLSLRGGRVCGARTALAVTSGKRKRKRRRRLWARDKGGLYRTRGNDSVATARGTKWLTRDGCRGTLTRVTEGAVSVRDLRKRKRVLVKAGHSYFARARA